MVEQPLHLVRRPRYWKVQFVVQSERERVSKAPPKDNQINQQQQASEAKRTVQFNKEVEVQTLLKENQQSKSEQQPGNSSTTSREELQSTSHRSDKKLQELVEEVNTKRRHGYEIFEDSDRAN